MIELVLFRTGAVDIVRSAFQPWLEGAAREERVVAPVWSALLRTNEGNVVFDTGLHPVHVDRPDATFGPQSGLKINVGRDVQKNATLELKLDFDANASLVQEGNGSWKLKPVLRLAP